VSLATRRRIARALRALPSTRHGPLLDFIDVGARGGIPRQWIPFKELVRVVAVEPDADEARRLAGDVIPHALADTVGVRALHLTESRGASSLLEPNTPFLSQFPEPERFEIARMVDVHTTTLDSENRGAPSFVKIDVQGAELSVLKGARQMLGTSVVGIEVETAFAPIYCGQSEFGDVHQMLTGHGFELVDLRPIYWRRAAPRRIPGTRGQLVFADALYLLSPSSLADREELATAACVACIAYGLEDWVVAYSSVLPEHAALRRASAIVQRDANRASGIHFRGRLRVGLWLKDLGDALLESNARWYTAEQRIGGTRRL
jgi:FkbM family methyltransferase